MKIKFKTGSFWNGCKIQLNICCHNQHQWRACHPLPVSLAVLCPEVLRHTTTLMLSAPVVDALCISLPVSSKNKTILSLVCLRWITPWSDWVLTGRISSEISSHFRFCDLHNLCHDALCDVNICLIPLQSSCLDILKFRGTHPCSLHAKTFWTLVSYPEP